jgi:serine protease Do
MKTVACQLLGLTTLIGLAGDPGRGQAPGEPQNQVYGKYIKRLTDPYQYIPYQSTYNPRGEAAVLQDLNAANQLGDWVYVNRDVADETLGATLQPVGEPLRSQLGLPEGQGLIVSSLEGEGPCALAGLKQHDILLTLGEASLKSADDLPQQLKAAGQGPVTLKFLREGKPVTLKVQPITRVTIGPVEASSNEYYIGVSIDAPDEATRSQLRLKEGEGVVINEVLKDSPAEKVGLKTHDIILELGGKAVDSAETLKARVQELKETPSMVKVQRGGKALTLNVTPSVRAVATGGSGASYRLAWVGQPTTAATLFRRLDANDKVAARANLWSNVRAHPTNVSTSVPAAKLEEVQKEVQALRESIERLEKALLETQKATGRK